MALAGCSSSEPASTAGGEATAQEQKAPEQKAPLSLDGTWKQVNSEADDSYQEAVISDGTITINWISPDTKSLYWVGTIPEIETTDDEFSWTSEGDIDEMASSIMASTSETKDFAYADGELTYELSALGVTTTVRMQLVE